MGSTEKTTRREGSQMLACHHCMIKPTECEGQQLGGMMETRVLPLLASNINGWPHATDKTIFTNSPHDFWPQKQPQRLATANQQTHKQALETLLQSYSHSMHARTQQPNPESAKILNPTRLLHMYSLFSEEHTHTHTQTTASVSC